MDPLHNISSPPRKILMTMKRIFNITDASHQWFFQEHELQQDSSSCGIMILKYAFQLTGSRWLNDIPEACRRKIMILLTNICSVSEKFCSYCRCIKPKYNSENTDWIQCDLCSRWVHVCCANVSISGYDKIPDDCEICGCLVEAIDDIRSPLKPTVEIVKSKNKAVRNLCVKTLSAPAHSSGSNTFDDSPSEYLELQSLKTSKARKCAGCKSSFTRDRLNPISSVNIILKYHHEKYIFNKKYGSSHMVKAHAYVHALTCIDKVNPHLKLTLGKTLIVTDAQIQLLNDHDLTHLKRELCVSLL